MQIRVQTELVKVMEQSKRQYTRKFMRVVRDAFDLTFGG